MVSRRFSRLFLASVPICAAIASAILVAPSRPGTAAEAMESAPLPAVSVVSARRGEIARRIRLTGSLIARHESLVTVDLDRALRVVEVIGEVGDEVVEGDVLARLDDTAVRIERDVNTAKLARAEAAIRQAEAQVTDAAVAQEEATSSLERGRTLKDRGITAADVLERLTYAASRAATTLDIARYALALAEADRAILSTERRDIEARLARTLVRAPATGRILRRAAKIGALVGSGSAELFAIAEKGEVEVAAEVPQMDFLDIPQGASVSMTVPGLEKSLTGVVRLMEPEMQATGRQGLLRIAITRDAGIPLPTGAFVRGEVEVDRRSSVLLPASAVETTEGRAEIHVVRDGVVATQSAVIGMRVNNLVEIVSGVEAGETIVLKAGSFLEPGDRVRPFLITYGESIADRPLELALDSQ
ncbi:efflux RND transporter periplasmic adaptor subunit [Jiella mangrovi]|uniref:Efflux RND transporter periplasmic adaptor subunit n=1 Tax=Jiella mangrovi TaxID=2821407 RepID=A0ABS4BGW5_9HYPH|nr:efflux RND transporter periplasmic adaptor subunit [Jiella mangrovi]MBP0615787.1 efflux RND transporter periplasmic adaptor subunit [Jiella mangrovi]